MENNNIKLAALGLAEAAETTIKVNDLTSIMVKSRVPYEQLFEMAQYAANALTTSAPFVSPLMRRVITDLLIAKNYTNLDIAILDQDNVALHDLYESYDLLAPWMSSIAAAVDQEQLAFFTNAVAETLDEYTKYVNSAQGIINSLAASAKENTDEINEALDLFNNDENADKLARLVKVINNI